MAQSSYLRYCHHLLKRFTCKPKLECISRHFVSRPSDESSLVSHTRRSHHCGELRSCDEGTEVTLCGWLQYQRMSGQFVTVRDAHGVTQVLIPKFMGPTLQEVVSQIPQESVVQVTGTVNKRPPNMDNKNMATGDIEIVAKEMKLLNPCQKQLPFHIHDFHEVTEKLKMEYRYLDLRNTKMQRNLRLRSKMMMKMREFLCNQHGFVDVETPTLFKRTPGGAKEFIVPTHTPGKFYSLPQSPQQFKQLLMVGGVDRYMQIARCYRDEKSKPDRQPEFTQLDLEMSFVNQEDINQITEELLVHVWPEHLPPLQTPFSHMTYLQAISHYGSDKPDTRFDMKLQDVTHVLSQLHNPKLFWLAEAVARYPTSSVQAINFTQAAKHLGARNYKELDSVARMYLRNKDSAPWYAVVKIKDDGEWQGSLGDHLGFDTQNHLNLHLNLHAGDLLLLAAGEHILTCSLLGRLRIEVADILEQKGENVRGDAEKMHMLWVDDFPLFLPKEDGTTGLESAHHPFTAPHNNDVTLVYTQPEVARSQHYDLVLNGCEIGGGSIRVHDSMLQKYILSEILKVDASSLQHLLDALDFGCPPHGGIALGLDRLLATVCGASSIRDVIAFPKSSKGEDVMARAPTELHPEDAAYYRIKPVDTGSGSGYETD